MLLPHSPQSLSSAPLHTLGQHPSPFVQAVVSGTHMALHAAAEPTKP
jgi:hypothetical protein